MSFSQDLVRRHAPITFESLVRQWLPVGAIVQYRDLTPSMQLRLARRNQREHEMHVQGFSWMANR